jgi:hypothetical protein
MLPQVISQHLVHIFKYWNEKICIGMRHGDELYTFVRSYPLSDRLQAYDHACQLAGTGGQVCITCSRWRYTIWLSLRTVSVEKLKQAQTLPGEFLQEVA